MNLLSGAAAFPLRRLINCPPPPISPPSSCVRVRPGAIPECWTVPAVEGSEFEGPTGHGPA